MTRGPRIKCRSCLEYKGLVWQFCSAGRAVVLREVRSLFDRGHSGKTRNSYSVAVVSQNMLVSPSQTRHALENPSLFFLVAPSLAGDQSIAVTVPRTCPQAKQPTQVERSTAFNSIPLTLNNMDRRLWLRCSIAPDQPWVRPQIEHLSIISSDPPPQNLKLALLASPD